MTHALSRPGAIFTLILMALIALLALGCSGAPAQADSDLAGRQIKAVATTGQVADLLANVGGERVEVVSLMGPGVDPHLYKASESDVSRLSSADIIFYNGLNLEGKMADLFERMASTRPTVAVAEAIPQDRLFQPPEFEGHFDPHVWFDPTLWTHTIDEAERALSDMDPDSAHIYRANADRYRAELEELHEWITAEMDTVPREQRVLVTAHDAFGYFGNQYDVEVVGLQGISTETEAGVADVQALVELIASRKIKAIFVESSVPRRNLEAVQAAVRARGHEVAIGGELFSDAMGEPGTPGGTYVGMIRHNVQTIASALR